MGKRSDFDRIERDFYPTPKKAVVPLTPHLTDCDGFVEPFVGNGALVRHLESFGHKLTFASDIEPQGDALRYASTLDAMALDGEHMGFWAATHIISNPPWPSPRAGGEPTVGLIKHLAAIRPTWLLLSSDFKHNAYSGQVMSFCRKVVSVGRVRWIEGSANDGKDNAAWYLFDANDPGPTIFFTRTGETAGRFAVDIEELL